MADEKDTFIVEITVDVNGQTTPEAVQCAVWKKLMDDPPEGYSFPASAAWRIFEPRPKPSTF